MDKEAVVEALEEIAVLLELKGENPFKTRAYTNGARALERWDGDLATAVNEESLGQIKGFGEALRKKVTELVTTGTLGYLDDLRDSVPDGLIEMLDLPGLGPKKIKALSGEFASAQGGDRRY